MADGTPVLRAGNIGNDLALDRDLVWVPSKLVSPNQRMRVGDIALCTSSGSSSVVGKSALLRRVWNGTVGAFCVLIRPNPTRCIPDYLAFVLRGAKFRRWTRNAAGASIKNIRKSDLERFPILLPPPEEQRRIVDILNRARRIETLRRRAAERLRELVPALFIKMFGDPGLNPKCWPQRQIGDVCEVQGGLQVSKKRSVHPMEVPYLRVANVLRDRLALDEIKLMRLTEAELMRTRLLPGDLLIVEGHGNAAEIGRVGVWDGQIRTCVHQNHLIRARPDHALLEPGFAAAYLNSSSGRQHLLRRGKTTSGLNTITTSDVKDCTMLVPPIGLQRRFSAIVARTQKTLNTTKTSAQSCLDLSASLMAHLVGRWA